MSKGGGGGQDPNSENSYALLWILAIIFVLAWVIWHFFQKQLITAFIAIKKYEILAVSFFFNNENVQKALQWAERADFYNITMKDASVISTFVGQYIMYPICGILGVMAIVMLKGTATMRFTKAYNMDTLAQQEKDNWPQISPVVDIDLISEDVNKGPWAMSMTPMQFAKHYKLLKVERIADRKAAWKQEGVTKATVIRDAATQIFASQLGPLWQGVDALPPHTKAIYAAFLARVEHDTDACRAYLAKMSRSAAKGTMDYSLTDEYIKKYQSKAADLCQKKHAYVSTVMIGMLTLARTDGVLAASDFLWVKPIDRRLWYVLNCVGRQVSVPEVAGIYAHYFAERELGRALTVPMVDEATNAFENAISNVVYIADEGEDIPQAEMS
ncbi:MAG: type IVB secretion system coupling complex protein DotM/IcmP [Candidatus Berkiella sp.]